VKERARKAWEIISREEGGRASRLAFAAPVLAMRTPSWERLAWVHSEGFVHHGVSRPLNERRRGRENKNSEKTNRARDTTSVDQRCPNRHANPRPCTDYTPAGLATLRNYWAHCDGNACRLYAYSAPDASEQCIEFGASCAWVLGLRGQIRTYCRYVLGSSIVAYQSGGRAWPAIFGFSESKAEAWSWDNVYP
jgi:hypothetical protein